MSAIRKLAGEAADKRAARAGIGPGDQPSESVKFTGIRVGNSLSQRQAQALLSTPDISTVRGLRDRAILGVLLGCGLRRSEVAALTFAHILSNATDAGASSISSESMVASEPRRCPRG